MIKGGEDEENIAQYLPICGEGNQIVDFFVIKCMPTILIVEITILSGADVSRSSPRYENPEIPSSTTIVFVACSARSQSSFSTASLARSKAAKCFGSRLLTESGVGFAVEGSPTKKKRIGLPSTAVV